MTDGRPSRRLELLQLHFITLIGRLGYSGDSEKKQHKRGCCSQSGCAGAMGRSKHAQVVNAAEDMREKGKRREAGSYGQ